MNYSHNHRRKQFQHLYREQNSTLFLVNTTVVDIYGMVMNYSSSLNVTQ